VGWAGVGSICLGGESLWGAWWGKGGLQYDVVRGALWVGGARGVRIAMGGQWGELSGEKGGGLEGSGECEWECSGRCGSRGWARCDCERIRGGGWVVLGGDERVVVIVRRWGVSGFYLSVEEFGCDLG